MARCYVSHPIAGQSEQEKRESELSAVHYVTYLLGMEPVLPRQIAPACEFEKDPKSNTCGIPGRFLSGDAHTVQCYLRGDLRELLWCDRILMMPGWEHSAGCRDELHVALVAGIPVTFYGWIERSM